MTREVELLDSDLLDLPPSCIEFCPTHSSWFVVGTYELDKSEDSASEAGRISQKDEVETEPFVVRESVVSSAPLSFHNYSEPSQGICSAETEAADGQNDRVGTEEVEEHSKVSTLQERNGSLMLYNIVGSSLRLYQSRPYPYGAIYDLHFCPTDPDYFAVSSSTGRISLFRVLVKENGSLDVIHVCTWKVFDDSVLITYFAWCPMKFGERNRSLVVTASTGVVQLVTITGNVNSESNSNDLGMKKHEPPLSYHTLKVPFVGEEPQYAYCCIWATSPEGLSQNFHGIFSGGDDSKLRICILGSPTETTDASFPYKLPTTFSGHDAAVISILPLPSGENHWVLLTGSYDNKVRVITMNWDTETKSKSINTSAILDIGGGAYRLEFLQHYTYQLKPEEDLSFRTLASCMEAGVKILEVNRRKKIWSIDVIGEIDIEDPRWSNPGDKTQLYYASAVKQSSEDEDSIFVSSCFNKRRLGVYRFPQP